MTVCQWLHDNVPNYSARDSHPISIEINGELVAPDLWAVTEFSPGDAVDVFVEAKGAELFIAAFTIKAALKFVTGLFMPKIPKMKSGGGEAGERLSDSTVKGNSVKINSPIREVSGTRKVYPDYLLPTHRYFLEPRKQVVELLLCVGKGEFDIPLSSVQIGDTPIISLGADAQLAIYQPGADLSGDISAKWWHSAEEVGSTSVGAAGLALTATAAVSPSPAASSIIFSGFTATIPSGAGSFPTGWEAGMIARIVAPYAYSIADGGAGRDVITGDMTQLGFAPGDLIEISGTNGGNYIVNTLVTGASGTMTLNYADGSPAIGLVTGVVAMCIGWRGLRYRITAASTSAISVERLKTDGSTDAGWTGWSSLTSSIATIVLDQSSTEGGWVGPFCACPDGDATNKIEWDIQFPQGLIWQGQKGEIFTATVTVEAQYRDFSTAGAWTSVSRTYNGTSLDQVGYTESVTLPGYIRPEVRFRRIGVTNNREISDKCELLGLRSSLAAPTSYAGVTTMTLRVIGGDKISSSSESLVSARVTRKLAPLSGGPVAVTRDIAPWVKYVTESAGYSVSEIDMSELTRLDAIWRARGDYYDDAINDKSTVKDVLDDALRAGFSELTVNRGLITPVRDEPRTIFEQMYSPQNMTRPLERQFTALTPDDFDGVDIEYTDNRTWQVETVQCRLPGDIGRRVEKMRLLGVTNRDKAWQIGMRQRRIQKYRRKPFKFETELDAMNSRYLSYCALGDDVPGYSQSAIMLGFAAMGGGFVIKSSEALDWSAGGAHVVAIRKPDGTLSGPHAATRIDDYRLTIPSIDFTPDVNGIEPPHLMFGPVTRWHYPVLITEITPGGQGAVSVSAVNYDARVYLDDDGVADN